MSRSERPEAGATSTWEEIRLRDKERKALRVLAFKGKIDTRILKGQALVVKEKVSAECRCWRSDFRRSTTNVKIKKMVGYAAKSRRKGSLCQIFLELFLGSGPLSSPPIHTRFIRSGRYVGNKGVV